MSGLGRMALLAMAGGVAYGIIRSGRKVITPGTMSASVDAVAKITKQIAEKTAPAQVGGTGGALWNNFSAVPNTPAGFTVKNVYHPTDNESGFTAMLEQWKAGSSEPPHAHPGDDMTIVVEGRMQIQFFSRDAAGKLKEDGQPIELISGQTGYIEANRIHDAKYIEDCKIVYVHDKAFEFKSQE